MITVTEAQAIINKTSKELASEKLPIAESVGRTLAEDLSADRDFPPFNRVTMDGIAINWNAYGMGSRDFQIAGTAAAGAPQMHLAEPTTHCIEVMTGAMLPTGADTVIRYEDLEIAGGMAKILIEDLTQGKNVHRQGTDRTKGSVIVTAPRQIGPAEIGVATTIGKTHLEVKKLPKAIIISTGDELVPIEKEPLPHQIRRSNVYSIHTVLKDFGIDATVVHIDDDWESILNTIRKILEEYEMIILSGGVSKGKFDYLPKAFAELGVTKLFHKIKQRPGKPFWFGTAPNGATLFALPGNPVSSFLCTNRYILPWLRKSLSIAAKPKYAKLKEDFYFKPDLTYFLQVDLEMDEQGTLWAKPVEGNGSGDLANLVDADAFLELPRGRDQFHQGEVFPIINYR